MAAKRHGEREQEFGVADAPPDPAPSTVSPPERIAQSFATGWSCAAA